MTPWESSEFAQHEQVCSFHDHCTGLKAIVAIHSTSLGPAVGGTRFLPYPDDRMAVDDALRLSRSMSYKCALADLPFGGGKGVIIGDPAAVKKESLLLAYGECLNRLGSNFCTGQDVGFSVEDCEIVRRVTPYLAGTNSSGVGDPSTHTAMGVFHGLRAVVEVRLNKESFEGVHIAVQGLGSVGWKLCQLLHEAGAQLTVADAQNDLPAEAQRAFAAQVVEPQAIHAVNADIFAPCALGGVLNSFTIDAICAKAIAGAANNQLESAAIGEALHKRGILFAPDYVINAGGVIGAAEEAARVFERTQASLVPLETRLQGIYQRLHDIFHRADVESSTPEAAAQRMAQDLISQAERPSSI